MFFSPCPPSRIPGPTPSSFIIRTRVFSTDEMAIETRDARGVSDDVVYRFLKNQIDIVADVRVDDPGKIKDLDRERVFDFGADKKSGSKKSACGRADRAPHRDAHRWTTPCR